MSGRGDWDLVSHSLFSGCHLEEAGSLELLSLIRGWLERAGALAPAAGKALLGSSVSFLGGGQGARPPWLPGELASQARCSGSLAAPALARCCPGSAHAPGRPDSDGGAPAAERPASAASPLQLWTPDVRGSSFTPDQSLSRPASAFSLGCREGNETWLKSPRWDLLQQGTPQARTATLFP